MSGLPPENSQLYLYLDVASQLEGAEAYARRFKSFDEFSMRSLRCLDYLVLSVDLEQAFDRSSVGGDRKRYRALSQSIDPGSL